MNEHKNDIINAAIQGLIQGGWDKLYAESLYILLERVYNCGYNEARRNIEENPRDWEAYSILMTNEELVNTLRIASKSVNYNIALAMLLTMAAERIEELNDE